MVDLSQFPKGFYVVLTGSPQTGYKHWGPFETVQEAVDWSKERVPFLGNCTVMTVYPSESCPVRVNRE